MKNGLIEEKGRLVYYENDQRKHAGAVKIGDDIYYISSHGYAVSGEHVVHGSMCNGLLKRGTYTFAEDGKVIMDSFVPAKKHRKLHKHINTVKHFIKKQWPLCAVIAVTFLVLIVAEMRNDIDISSGGETGEQAYVLPEFEQDVMLCSDYAKKLYDGEITVKKAVSAGAPYKHFSFEYDLNGKTGTFSLSENEDMSNARGYELSAERSKLTIDNLKTGTVYYYSFLIDGENITGQFRTAESTRFITIPGVSNTRDIGGYTTVDGKTVRQGMLIRGSEIDGLVDPGYFIENDDIAYVRETFGFVCDLDLRDESLANSSYKTRLGDRVKHEFYSSPSLGGIFLEKNGDSLCRIFKALAEPSNYPMYLHCTNGGDRTGTVCFLLEGVLNMPEEVMQNDFGMTGFYYKDYAAAESYNTIYGGLEGYDGDTVQEKTVSFLLSVGVTQDEINSIRSIFLY